MFIIINRATGNSLIYNDKKDSNSLTESSTNILQLQIDDKKIDSEKIIERIKKNLNYLNLKSFSSDLETRQFNFWFDVDQKKLTILINDIEKISSENENIKIQIFSRSGIYE